MLLLSAGWNDNGELGRYIDFEEDENDTAAPVDVDADKIKYVASGQSHSILIFNDGTVMGWGSNHSGQIGLSERMIFPFPTKIEFLEDKKIESASCSTFSTAFLSKTGAVYVANSNNKYPKMANINEFVIKCSNGYESIWAIGESGKFYEITKDKINQYSLNTSVVDASSGKSFAIAVTKDGVTYGIGDVAGNSKTFTPIQSLSQAKIKRVFANAKHCFALDDSGQVYAWGNGEYGQLGLEKTFSTNVFMKINSLNSVKEICTSSLTTCFLTTDNRIYVCGYYGSYLILNSKEKIDSPVDATRSVYGPALLAACGDHHTLVYAEGKLKYEEKFIDPEILALRDRNKTQEEELEALRRKAEEEEEAKRKAEEEAITLQRRAEEEAEMKRKAEEEAELLRQRAEEEAAERRRRQKAEEAERKRLEEERRRKAEEEEAERKRLEEERRRKAEEEEAERLRRERELEEERKRQAEEEAELRRQKEQEALEMKRRADEEEALRKQREAELEAMKKKNAAANSTVEELNKEIENLKNDLAAKSKCCNIC